MMKSLNFLRISFPLQTPLNLKRPLITLEKGLLSVCSDIPTSLIDDDVCLLQQFKEQLLGEFHQNLLSIEIEDTSELSQLLARVEKQLFDSTLEIWKQLRSCSSYLPTSSSISDTKGVKLPKLDVPTFVGNILNWKTFWEQFNIAVHVQPNLQILRN